MTDKTARVLDPVCLMWVEPGQYTVEHQGLSYAFCSRQCQERFLANPSLYVSAAGYHAAAKQHGHELTRRRRWVLARTLTPPQRATVQEAISQMMGIVEVQVDEAAVTVGYDLLQATAAQIEACIEAQPEAALRRRWRDRLWRAWVHFLEENQVANLASQGSSHGHSGHHH